MGMATQMPRILGAMDLERVGALTPPRGRRHDGQWAALVRSLVRDDGLANVLDWPTNGKPMVKRTGPLRGAAFRLGYHLHIRQLTNGQVAVWVTPRNDTKG